MTIGPRAAINRGLPTDTGRPFSTFHSPSSSRTKRSEDPGSGSLGLSFIGHAGVVGGSPIPARALLGRDDEAEGREQTQRGHFAGTTILTPPTKKPHVRSGRNSDWTFRRAGRNVVVAVSGAAEVLL